MVESPLDKIEEEKARWRNMVLKRISEQIQFVWVKPDGTLPSQSGVIRMDIDAEGYLKGAWVRLTQWQCGSGCVYIKGYSQRMALSNTHIRQAKPLLPSFGVSLPRR